MQKYVVQVLPALDWLLQAPASDFERWLTLGAAILAGTLALWLAGRAFRFERPGFWRSLLVAPGVSRSINTGDN